MLACRDDFAARHAWLVAEALDKSRNVLPELQIPGSSSAEPPDLRIPLHSGALGYFKGAPMPGVEPHAHEDHTHGFDLAK